MKSQMSLKSGQIGSLSLSYIPLIVEKACDCLCHQHNSFSFDRICLKLAYKGDMDVIFNEIENWLSWIINLRVTPLDC